MALLDRFRTQSGHKNPDAAARLQFVQELPLDERELLTEVAREDADPRVRRAAVAKLMDPPALAAVAQGRCGRSRCGRRRCRCCATSRSKRSKGSARPRASPRSTAIDDPKTLIGIAKNASREATALRALARVTDGHALGSIARHAEHESVRRAAFDTLQRSRRAPQRRAQQRIQGSDARGGRTDHRPRRARADCRAREEQERVQARARDRARDGRAPRRRGAGGARGCRDAAAAAAAAGRRGRPRRDRRARRPRNATPEDGPRDAERAEAERLAREARDAAARPRVDLCERIEQLQGEKALEELELATAEWEGMPRARRSRRTTS